MDDNSVPFFVVLARDRSYVAKKIEELERLGVRYIIICGERLSHSHIVYRKPIGKYDAINFALEQESIPRDAQIIAFNDVDTRIYNYQPMLEKFRDQRVAIAFAAELVRKGPQHKFFTIFNPLRRLFPLAASGELMMMRKEVLCRILPLKPCKAEDTYMMFKTLELGYKVVFCEDSFAETERTKTGSKEELYKRKTVAGIYQALSFADPPFTVRFLYTVLPFLAMLFVFLGKDGYYTFKGVLLGFLDFQRGDRSGTWKTTYME